MSEFLFLDIDDVLNSEQYLEENRVIVEGRDPDDYPRAWIDPQAVQRLNSVLERTEADPEIVLSSTWRHSFSTEEMTEILQDRGFTGEVVSTTPGTPNTPGYSRTRGMTFDKKRGTNIRNFLVHKRRVDQVESLLVLDNLELEKLEPFEEYVVQTKPSDGLQDRHVEEALEVLGNSFSGVDLAIGSGR